MDAKHTPGPWIVGERWSGYVSIAKDNDFLPIVDASGNYVALADFPDLCNNADKADANARLIAAAPELAKAALDIVERFDAYGTLDTSDGEDDVDRLRAALAKAGL